MMARNVLESKRSSAGSVRLLPDAGPAYAKVLVVYGSRHLRGSDVASQISIGDWLQPNSAASEDPP